MDDEIRNDEINEQNAEQQAAEEATDETRQDAETAEETADVAENADGSDAETGDESAESEADDAENAADDDDDLEEDMHSDYRPVNRFDASAVHHLSGMYQNWFLDYASYVILERAVPHIDDGLKPVQRRILHSMKRMDDGRYNKVANIVGHTMQFHPHGDASIGGALVQMGQKELLIDTQGNWGNILTGDPAAAPRYIEARLSKFALEVIFNPKTTNWQMSYDGRNKEPITLPAKFPLLLAQGAEGIAVGLSSKILPHNFNELCDAAISYLRKQPFQLYPDFPTGGSIDVNKYNDGQRGGVLKVRAKIEKLDAKTLVIRELPYSKTVSSLKESITKAIEKGKIKARNVTDLTSAKVEVQVHLSPGVSSDKTIDALYAFTDCEINLSPNCCVIEDNKPKFLTVSDVLRHSVDNTKELLRKELQIRRNELTEQLFFASLERIFIEERIYKDRSFEEAKNLDEVVKHVDSRLEPYKKDFVREITRDDIIKLLEIKMQRILKFNKDKADELIAKILDEIKKIDRDLARMTEVTIRWFKMLKDKYGADHPRLTERKNFDTIEAAKVAEANEKLYINRSEGFIGTGLKKDEFVCNCSDLDDLIVFYKDGKYKVIRVAEKVFVGKNVLHVQVFKKNDKRTIYNVVYRDGRKGTSYIKRFFVPSITRDKENDLTKGTPGSKILYFSANPNGEAETIKVTFDPAIRQRNLIITRDFSDISIKSRTAKGVILSKLPIARISLKSHGFSTLGGRKVWFDPDINRLNYENHGTYLGEFKDDDAILVILDNGEFYLTNFDSNNHFEDNIERIEKWDKEKVWTAVVYDADNGGYPYVKRFMIEAGKKHVLMAGENKNSKLVFYTDQPYPRIRVTFGGKDKAREPQEIELEEFTGLKPAKNRGKRLCTLNTKSIELIEPTRFPEPKEDENAEQEAENAEQEGAAEAPQEAELPLEITENQEETSAETEPNVAEEETESPEASEEKAETSEEEPEPEEPKEPSEPKEPEEKSEPKEEEKAPKEEAPKEEKKPTRRAKKKDSDKPIKQNPNDIPFQLSLFPDE